MMQEASNTNACHSAPARQNGVPLRRPEAAALERGAHCATLISGPRANQAKTLAGHLAGGCESLGARIEQSQPESRASPLFMVHKKNSPI